jgi:hypothetical protein
MRMSQYRKRINGSVFIIPILVYTIRYNAHIQNIHK